MLECQRNGESSFAVSASTCIRRNNGGCEGVRKGSGGKGSRGKDARRARTWVCSGAVCRAHSCDLQLMKLRVQSRRMSNKYVSRHPLAATPVHTVVHLRSAPGPVIPTPSCTTTYPLHPLPSQPLPLPLAAPRRPSSRESSSVPRIVNRLLLPPLTLTLWSARSSATSLLSIRPFGFRMV